MKKAALIILDGWGLGDGGKSDGISTAKTPNFDNYIGSYSNSTLKTFGENVGLPKGQMGNSEVGHLNIGAGRIVYQDLARINKEIELDALRENRVLLEAIKYAEVNGVKLHLMGLLSRGGVHSSHDHLNALVDIVEGSKCEQVFVHAFTDGRDTSPTSGADSLEELQLFLKEKKTRLASVIGRYFAMDRDHRWERIKKAYDALVSGIGAESDDFAVAARAQYEAGAYDEFLEPMIMSSKSGLVEDGDVVLCFNFRTDRCRQISHALTQKDLPEFGMKTLNLNYNTMTRYDESFVGVNVLYEKANLLNTLGEVIASNGGSQLRIAETEKYPHVTFFFSGGREKPYERESRIVVQSPKVATYDLQPEMSAPEVRDACVRFLKDEMPDFVCLNFANPDMVGHTGVFDAIVEAVETIDRLMKDVVDAATEAAYSTIIIADHGNADQCMMPDGSPHTAHTTNPVPCILIGDSRQIRDGILADVAPTILELMDVVQPKEMTGRSLLQ
ncbi:MAG TPA: 2,3-bisphosphoglycerate-independent phosphoglycerate mutase [Flavobacteriales bacterium]|nr:2,3-bisphosphoglycerate-independent phosphoglycerate mutase [Flavobacteriales bacterium]